MPVRTEVPTGPWFARGLGVAATSLALVYLFSCILVPPTAGDQVAFGLRFVGPLGWLMSAAHALFFVWLAWLCFTRRRLAASVVIGYCVYLVENVWIYCVGPGRVHFQNTAGMLTVNALLTAVLLAFARVVMSRRSSFDR